MRVVLIAALLFATALAAPSLRAEPATDALATLSSNVAITAAEATDTALIEAPANALAQLPGSSQPGGRPQTAAAPTEPPSSGLATLGMILIGVIGLFWIRRHTSEL